MPYPGSGLQGMCFFGWLLLLLKSGPKHGAFSKRHFKHFKAAPQIASQILVSLPAGTRTWGSCFLLASEC